MDLKDIFELVKKGWPCELGQYPSYPSTGTEEEKTRFVLTHILSHINMTTGDLATVVEIYDHGRELDRKKLINASKQLMLQSVRIALLAEASPEDLKNLLQTWANKNIK